MNKLRIALCAGLLGTTLAFVSAGGAQAAGPLRLGIFDAAVYDADASLRSTWMDRTAAIGASIVRLQASWGEIAPSAPAAGTAADPANAAYHWGELDGAVSDAAGRGIEVLINIGSAPRWAQGPNPPAGTKPGSWRPDAAAFGAFAEAVARRYSGSFRPAGGNQLPRARYWQAWNEPNLSTYLAPQWDESGGRPTPESPEIYRAMLNSFYEHVKAVNPDNVVVTAGTAPFGDPTPGGPRIPPARFVRALLCVDDRRLRPQPCPQPAHFDALDHHPYSIGGPLRKALNRDDVSLPDMGKLSRPLKAAVASGGALPAAPKQLWATELSWDSSPPDPDGVPAATQARWLSQAFYVLWRQGVGVAMWYQLRDAPPIPSYATTYQSGLFLLDGRPKPSAQAFRFPFVVDRAGRRTRLWGKAPGPGPVTIQRRRGSSWSDLTTVQAGADGVFDVVVGLGGHPTLRATTPPAASLPARRPG
jgi:hypothetical protein